MRRPGSILLLAIVLGALSAAMVYRYVSRQQHEIELARRAAGGKTVDLVVANVSIPVGTRIDANQVRVVPWPVDVVPEGAIRDPGQVKDGIARVTIERNQPVLDSSLVRPGTGLLPLIISEGMRGMSVKVDPVTGVSGFITPNSRVDVIAAGSPEGDRDQRSKVILQNVRVLATGKSIEQRDEKPVEVPTVTLLVTPEDAEKLTLATYRDPIRLALRNYRDDEIIRTPGMSSSALFASDGRVATDGAKAKNPSGGGAARPSYSVEVFLGDKRTRQSLF
jgi:pilus assembly protein CpaB